MPAGKILVVDDSPDELRAMVEALEGYTIITAANGEEALAQAMAERPDVVVVKILLPKKNGFQVCRQLKTTPATAHMRVILVSGKNHESDKFWGLKQGADEYVIKPFEGSELRAIMTKHLA